jgi:hypothetical protein
MTCCPSRSFRRARRLRTYVTARIGQIGAAVEHIVDSSKRRGALLTLGPPVTAGPW